MNQSASYNCANSTSSRNAAQRIGSTGWSGLTVRVPSARVVCLGFLSGKTFWRNFCKAKVIVRLIESLDVT